MQESPEEPDAGEEDKAKEREEVRKMWRSAGDFGFIGIEFGIATAIGFYFGRWLDGHFDTKPWLSMFFALCGIAAASRDLIRLVRRAQRED